MPDVLLYPFHVLFGMASREYAKNNMNWLVLNPATRQQKDVLHNLSTWRIRTAPEGALSELR